MATIKRAKANFEFLLVNAEVNGVFEKGTQRGETLVAVMIWFEK